MASLFSFLFLVICLVVVLNMRLTKKVFNAAETVVDESSTIITATMPEIRKLSIIGVTAARQSAEQAYLDALSSRFNGETDHALLAQYQKEQSKVVAKLLNLK